MYLLGLIRRKRSFRTIAMIGLVISMICANTTPVFTKSLYDQGWTPIGTYFLTVLIMTLLLAVHEFMALERGERWGMDRRDVVGTLLTTITGGFISPVCFFTGLEYVEASESVLLTSLLPFFIVIFAVMFLKEKFTPATIMGGLVLVASLVVLLYQDIVSANISPGVPLLLLSSVSGAMTTIFHKKFVRHRHLDSIVLVRSALSLVLLGIWMVFLEPESFIRLWEPQNVWITLGLPIIGFLMPFFLYFRALQHVTAMEAGFVATLGPVAGVVLAVIFRGDQIATHQAISLIMVMFGILLINVPLTRLRIVPSRLLEIGPLRR